MDSEVAEYPHQCRYPLIQLLHSWVFARVDGTVYPQCPRRDEVEAVGVALKDVDVQAFTCVNDVVALVDGVNARKTPLGSTSCPISSPKNSVVSCGYKIMVELQR